MDAGAEFAMQHGLACSWTVEACRLVYMSGFVLLCFAAPKDEVAARTFVL